MFWWGSWSLLLLGIPLCLCVSVVQFHGHGPAPVADAGADVPGHGAGGGPGVAGEQGLDDGEVFAGLLAQAVEVVAGLVVGPGHVAEGAEEGLEAADFLGEERVPAGVGD